MKIIGKFLSLVIVTTFLSFHVFAGKYVVNTHHSEVKWNAKKVTGEHYGTINIKDGFVLVGEGKINGGTFHIDMNSIVDEDLKDESWNQKLVGHLKSDDFFSVDKYPVTELEIKAVKSKGGNSYVFEGDLTIKGITAPIEFDADVEMKDGKLMASGNIVVDRTKYDIKYRSGKFFPDIGDKLIYDEFTLNFKLVADIQ